jgi:hypothetical protein
VKATKQFTTFVSDGQNGVAIISGDAEINGKGSYKFVARLSDLGEPGTNDTFGLTVAAKDEPTTPVILISPDQQIKGGNIQFHKPKPGTCEGTPPPEEIFPPEPE